MRTIYRYPLRVTDHQTVTGPGLSRVVSVDNRRGELEVWAEVDTSQPSRTIDVVIVGTGNPMAGRVEDCAYVGHVIDGQFIWHIYAEEG